MVITRELGQNEKILTKLNQLACTWNIAIVSRIKGLLDGETLIQAFDFVRQRHTILNSRIVKSSGKLYFEELREIPTLPLRIIRDFKGCIWEEIVQQELNLKITSQGCLLRAIIVYPLAEKDTTYLITLLHHAVSDGQSSMQLHAEILTYCQQIARGDSITIKTVDALPILPPVEAFLPQWTKGLKGFFNGYLYLLRLVVEKIWHQPKTLSFEKYLPVGLRHCNLIHRQLDSGLTENLITLCKKEGTSVHAALSAAMILTAMRKINPLPDKEICISCKSSVNLRKRLFPPISNYKMGAFASLLMSYVKVQKKIEFWDLAREVKKQIDFSLKRKDDFRMLIASDFLFHYLLTFPREIASTVHISNVGSISIPRNYDPFILEEISFATANRFYGGSYTVEVTTFQEKLFLNFVFVEPLISKSTMCELVDDTISQIVGICQTAVL
jgi:hypothetical protein